MIIIVTYMHAMKILSPFDQSVSFLSLATISIHLWLETTIAWNDSQYAYGWNPLPCCLLLGHWIALCDLLLMVVS